MGSSLPSSVHLDFRLTYQRRWFYLQYETKRSVELMYAHMPTAPLAAEVASVF